MNIRYWVAGWRGKRLPYVYRRGPVPYTACRKASGRGYFRRFHTFCERRENDYVAHDDDCTSLGIIVRAPRRSPALPNVWDDLHVGRRGNGWKHQRMTQHKVAR